MPPIFDSGVKSYVIGVYTVQQPFPVNWKGEPDVRCEMCRFYNWQKRCRLNDQIVEYPDRYIGSNCPLIFEEENNE